jgi:hypothetical protein
MELTLLMDDEAVTKALFDDRKIGRENVFDLPLYYPLLRAMWTWRVNSGKTRETSSFATYLQRLNTTHPIENALAAEARYDEADVEDGVLSQEVYFKKYEKLVAQYFVIAFRRFWFDDGIGTVALAFELPSPVSVTIGEKDGIIVKFGRSCVARQKASSSLPENIFVVTRYRSNVLFSVVYESWKQHMDAARQLISRKTDVELISFAIWLQDMHRHLHVCVAVDHRGVVAPTAGTSAVLPTYAKTEALLCMVNPDAPRLVTNRAATYTVIHRTCTTRKHTRMLLCVGYAVEEGSSHSQKNMMVAAVVRPSLPTKREDDLQRSVMAEEVRVLFFD